MPRVGANDSHDAVAPNDLAVAADFFDRCQYFHDCLAPIAALRAALNPSPVYFARKMIRARVKSYGVSSTVTLSPGKILM